MERFIGIAQQSNHCQKPLFKIQYGEIYRAQKIVIYGPEGIFKIQYGEIYSQPLLQMLDHLR